MATSSFATKKYLIEKINEELLRPAPYITNINWNPWMTHEEIKQGLITITNSLYSYYNYSVSSLLEAKVNFLLLVLEAIKDNSFFK